MSFKFQVINPLLHSDLRLKIMVALDSLDSANFMYLCKITESTRGNLSVQIRILQEAGYLEVTKTGIGRFGNTTCRITSKGQKALRVYEEGLRLLFSQKVPAEEEGVLPSVG